MSETVKLIIEIPKEIADDIKEAYKGDDVLYCAVKYSTPLANDSDRAEVQAYFDGEAYGWEQGRKALIDDVKAEIDDEWARTHHMYPEYAGGLSYAYEIIDKHISGEGNKE